MEAQERDDKGLQEGSRNGEDGLNLSDIVGEGWGCLAGWWGGSGEGRSEPQFWRVQGEATVVGSWD